MKQSQISRSGSRSRLGHLFSRSILGLSLAGLALWMSSSPAAGATTVTVTRHYRPAPPMPPTYEDHPIVEPPTIYVRPYGSLYRPEPYHNLTYSRPLYPDYPDLLIRAYAPIGSNQTLIYDVQKELQRLGYYRAPLDGIIGPATREAIRAYQADQTLKVTGQIDFILVRSLGIA